MSKLSVVVLAYNHEKYISQALDSILMQKTGFDFEIIIGEDDSSDNTRKICRSYAKKFPKKIRLIENDRKNVIYIDGNATGRWNLINLFKKARGEYIAMCEGDDYWIDNKKLQKMVDFLEAQKDYAICFHPVKWLKNGKLIDEPHLPPENHDFFTADDLFLHDNFIRTSSVMYRNYFKGDLPQWFNYVSFGDISLHLMHSQFGKIGCIYEVMGIYRVHDNGIYSGEKTYVNLFKSIKTYSIIAENLGFDNNSSFKIGQARLLIGMAKESEKVAARLQQEAQEQLDAAQFGGTLEQKAKTPEKNKNAKPLVSVIVPTYNRPDGLRNALKSIAAQTYKNVEAVVVNDAGEDVQHVIDSFQDRLNIIYVQHDENKHLAATRNTGLAAASGDYIAYLDDDDIFYPDHLTTAIDVLSNSAFDVVYTDAFRAHQFLENGAYKTLHKDIPYSIDFHADRILLGNFFPVLCVVHKKSCLEKAGLFDESLRTQEDWDLWIRLSRYFDFMHIKKITCEFSFRYDHSSMTRNIRDQFVGSTRTIYSKYKRFVEGRQNLIDYQQNHLQNLEKEVLQLKKLTEQKKQDEVLNPDYRGPLVSIIIPLYNQLQYTQMCLSAVLKNTLYAPYEIIFVNDASEDGTYEYLEELKQKNKTIKIIHNQQNLNFAGSCNRGARAAEGEYIVFLNNDTEVQKEWLVNLVAMAHNDPQIGAVGSKLLYPNGTIQHAGVLVTRDEKAGNLLAPWHLHNGKPGNFEPANKPHYFQAVTAACMLVSKEAFEQVGGFDEGYRNGYEDVDLCFTMAEQGRRIVYQPESVVIHHESKSGPRRFAFMDDNTKRLHGKWLAKIVPDTVLKKDGTVQIVKDSKTRPYSNWHSRFVPDMNGQMTLSPAQHNDRQVVHDNDQVATLSLSKGSQSNADSNIKAETHNTDSELRIGYLSLGSDNLACPQLRLKSPLTALQKQGAIKISPFNLQDGKKVSLNLNDLRSLDILIIQRHFTAVFSYQQLIAALGERRPKIIFEFDDALDRLPQSNPGYTYHQQLKPRFEEYIRNADLVTVSTEQLKEYYSAWNAHIVVLPNLLDEDIWQKSFKKAPKKSGKIRMLFAGTSTHAADFALIEAAVKKILDEYNEVELLLWGEEDVSLKGSNVKVLTEFEFTYANYAKSLQKLNVDFALVPLADDAFNRGKSNIKWLEYSASKIPAIYSDVRPYSDFVRHNKTGILAKNETERWYKAIKNLINNPKKRKAISRAAHKEVWENFILQSHLSKWQKTYIRLIESNTLLSDDSNKNSHFERSEESSHHMNKLIGNERPIRSVSSEKILSPKIRSQNDKAGLVSIIIPVFNKLDFTKGCIEAIYKNTQIADFEIIIVDNASTDGTLEYLIEIQSNKDNFVVISNKENAGFAGANNQAAKIATGKYLVFLNNDTAVQPGWLKAMLNIIENDNEVGAVGSKLLYEDGTIQHAGVWILDHKPSDDPLLARNAYVNQPQDFTPANMAMTYQAVTAACMLVDNELYRRLGGFDEGFWNGYEDVDLCFRIAAQGKKIVYEPQSVITHFESKSGAERFSKVKENIERLHQKWLNKIKADYIVDSDNNVQPTNHQRIAPYVRTRAQESQKPFVSIIMLTFNALEYTKKCIQSIQQHTKYPHEIIIVDNGSKDGTRKYLRELDKTFEHIHIRLNKKNKGFSGGNNQGAKLAKGRYVFFLNNDTLVSDGWLESMVKALEADEKIGMVGPLTNSISGLQMVTNIKYTNDPGFYEYTATIRKEYVSKLTPRRRIAGFAFIMKKELYTEIGGFDESYGTGNFEDDDLCLRVRQAGYAIMVDESTFIHHYGSQTFKANKIDMLQSLDEKGKVFKEKWPDVDYEELLEMKNPLSDAHLQKMKTAGQFIFQAAYPDAKALYDSILSEHPLHSEALLGAALCSNQLQQFDEGLPYLNKLLKREPNNGHALNQAGLALSGKGDLQAAKSSFVLAIEKDPGLVDAQRNYGDVLIELGEYEAGIEIFQTILKNHPNDLPALLYMSQIYLEAGHPEKALEQAEKVLRIVPEHTLGHQLKDIIEKELETESGRLEYAIGVLPYHERSGGTIVSHKLCHLLNEAGEKASVFPLTGREQIFTLNPKFNTPLRDRKIPFGDNEIVVYPEIVSGNPVKAKHVVRWLLNKPGVIGGDGKFQVSDMIFYQNPEFMPDSINGEKLRILHTDFELFKNLNKKRQGACYFKGKCKKPVYVHDRTAREITASMANEEIAHLFNTTERFYCYDNFSFLSKLASLCGCLSIVIPDGTTDKDSFKKRNPVGVAFGLDDLEHARATLAEVKTLLLKWQEETSADVRNFISRTKEMRWQHIKEQSATLNKTEEDILGEALGQIQEKRFEKALALLSQLVNENAENAQALNLIGLAFAGKGDLALAKESFRLAIQKDPALIDAQRNYGDTLIELEDYENGVRFFQTILEKHPDDVPSLLYMTDLNIETERFEEAGIYCTLALKADPENELALQYNALLETVSQERDPKLKAFEGEIERANRLLEQGESDAAEAVYQTVLNKNPSDLSALFGMATACQMKEAFDQSREWLQKALFFHANVPEIFNLLGSLDLIQENPRAACDNFSRSLEINPSQTEIRNRLADALLMDEQYEQGIQLLLNTQKEFPGDSATLLHLGSVYLEAGRDEEAETLFRKVLDLEPDNKPVLDYFETKA